MADIYKNKDADLINKDLSEQFKKDDKMWYRDDQEIYGSAKKVIEGYITEIKSSKSENFGPHALRPFTDLQKAFDVEWTRISKLSGWASLKLCTDNKNLINMLANQIDDAEKIILESLALNRATYATQDIEHNKKAGSEFFKTSPKGEILLTAAVNKPTIQEVLWKLFKNDTTRKYLIDYSACSNATIKANMQAKLGTTTCWISYDNAKGTYLLKDSNGNPLSSRALIWEGVKLIPEGVVSVQAKQKMDEQLSERTDKLLNKKITATEIQELKTQVPASLRSKLNSRGILPDFLTKVDKRVGEMIIRAKQNGYELRHDAVSKLNFSGGLMEVHFMYNNIHTGESAKKDKKVWENDKELGHDLYSLLDSNEWELKTYLETRFHALWDNYDHLTKRSDLLGGLSDTKDLTAEEQEILSQKKESTVYSLTLFQQMLKNMREKEGTTWDDDEKEFNEMLKFVRDALSSLERHTPNAEELEKNIISPLKTKWRKFQSENISTGNRGSDQIFSEIFSHDKNTIIKGMRKLWQGTTVFGNTHTKFLAEEIAQNSTDLEIKNTDLNRYFQNLTTKLDITDTDNENTITQKKKLIDGLYLNTSGGEILNYLIEKGLVPTNWKGNEDVTKECVKIKDKLDQKQLQMKQQKDIYMHIDSHVHTQISEQKLRLEQKTDKTEKELQELQAYTYLVEHPSESTEMFEMVKENLLANLDPKETKYRGIGSLVRANLLGSFVDKGNGVKGTNADILEDMYGVGWFNLSDENSAELGPMIVEIIITVVVTVVLSLCTFGAWWAAFLATRALAHAGVKTAMKIAAKQAAKQLLKQWAKQMAKQWVKQAIKWSLKNLTQTLTEQWLKQWIKEVGKQAVKKTVLKGSKLLLREAPMFNALNGVAHNVLAGKEAFDGMEVNNANPFSQENLQTAAFLMVLHAFNAPGSVLRAGKPLEFSLKNSVKWGLAKWLPLSAEFGAMLGAEQAMNLTFGSPLLDESWNPVIDENGEMVMERGFHMPTAMEASQILGMVLAFKIPMVNKMLTKWSDHWFERIDTKTGERGVIEIESQLKSQERKVKVQREKVAEKQQARDLTNHQITDIKRAQEAVSQKMPESVESKAKDIAKNRESYYESFAKDSHSDLYERYQQYLTENPINKANALKTLDTEFAERLILDNPASQRITYGVDKARAELSFQKLQELSKYKKNLELTQTSTGERVISYVEGIGKLKPLESRVKVQERELNDLDTELNRRVKEQEGLQFEKKEVINEFIRENESLSKSDFEELFGKDPTTTVIKQWELWLCYEYTANTLLKNTDFFEAFIRTSMKKIDANHFSMEMPLADGKTYTIKISKAELEASHTLPDGRKIPAVSDTQLWFQIMEMAFIKHSVLMTRDVSHKWPIKDWSPESELIKTVIDEFAKTGDFRITGDMLIMLEGWTSTLALLDMLGSYSTFDIKPLNSREILKLPADSMISVHSDISKLESRGIEVLKTESGEPYYLIDGILLQPGHAYALTKRWADFYEVLNPHDTSKPIRMTHEQFEKAFTEYDVYRPDLAKILSKKVSHEITDKGKTIKKENKDIGKKKYDSARESNENPELEIKIPKRNPNGLHEANTSKQSIEKVKRSSDVVAIGDLHGEMIALEGNLKSAKLIDENGNWIGGNKKVVFQWDIIADRWTEGLEILLKIHELRKQVQKYGGDIEVIVGNHDDFMISFLTGRNGVHWKGIEMTGDGMGRQWKWMLELYDFIDVSGNFPDAIVVFDAILRNEPREWGLRNTKNIAEWKNKLLDSSISSSERQKYINTAKQLYARHMLKSNPWKVLSNMSTSVEWKIILEEICNMKVVSQINDALILHTNPTDGILRFLIEGWGSLQQRIGLINSKYQWYLKQMLIEWKTLTTQEMKEFNGISDLFLDTGNSRNPIDRWGTLEKNGMSTNESLYTQLNKQGINYITHGHDGGDGFSQKYGGVEIIDNDYSYGKRGNVSGKNAVSVIGKKNGKFRHITEHLDAIEERSSIKDIVEINNKTLKQPKLEGKTQKEQIKNLVEKATVYEDRFINAVDEIGSLTKWKRAGLEKNIIKKEERIGSKIEKDYKGDVENCLDVLRSTLTFETLPDLIMAYDQLPFFLQQHGMSIVKLKNRLADPKTWEILMNIKMSDGTIAELKLSTEHMYHAQDGLTKLPDDVEISFENVASHTIKQRNLSNLFTEAEVKLVFLLQANGLADKSLSLEIGYFNKDISNHMFYEIARCFDAETMASINNNENLSELNVDLQTLINKLEAIQVVNGEYHMKQYEIKTHLIYN